MTNSITVYSYDGDGLFLGEAIAYEDRFASGSYLLPANTTVIQPPTVNAYEIAVWDGSSWSVHPDNRGTWYDIYTQIPVFIETIDVPSPVDHTDLPPPEGEYTWQFTGIAWERTLESAKNEKRVEIGDAYKATLTASLNFMGRDYPTSDLFMTFLEIGVEIGGGMIDVYDVTHDTFQIVLNDAESLRDAVYAAKVLNILNREVKYKAIEDAGDIPTVDAISW